MHNLQLLGGAQNVDRFSLRGCFLVIGAFGVVTLISYFNELAKAGLLSGQNSYSGYRSKGLELIRRTDHPADHNDPVILKKDGGFHHLDLNLLPLQREAKNESQQPDDEEIQIALHLSKDDEYLQKNTSSAKIYQYHNVLPNFFLNLNLTLGKILVETGNFSADDDKGIVKNFTRSVLHTSLADYRNRTRVLLYQHDPIGYAARDCFLSLAIREKLVFAQAPLNAMYRKNWELMSRTQKERFDVLYGGLSFGTCESMSRPCSYAAVISHPLDRLLQAYWYCSGKSAINRTMCRFLHIDNMTSVHNFLEHHGSSLFQKLLYYSRHCRLVGQDEVCIHDNKVYFFLSQNEKEQYLADIIQNIEQWFSVVGLMDNVETSLNLLQTATGLAMNQCGKPLKPPARFFQVFHRFHSFSPLTQDQLETLDIDGVPYYELRAQLLDDPEVEGWLSADMAIYNKFVEVFQRQLQVYKDLKRLMLRYFSPEPMNEQVSITVGAQQSVMEGNTTVTADQDNHPSELVNSEEWTTTVVNIATPNEVNTTQDLPDAENKTTAAAANSADAPKTVVKKDTQPLGLFSKRNRFSGHKRKTAQAMDKPSLQILRDHQKYQ